jgi:hypothetical protein
MATLKIRKGRTAAMLRKLAKEETDVRVARRLLAIANALCGLIVAITFVIALVFTRRARHMMPGQHRLLLLRGFLLARAHDFGPLFVTDFLRRRRQLLLDFLADFGVLALAPRLKQALESRRGTRESRCQHARRAFGRHGQASLDAATGPACLP